MEKNAKLAIFIGSFLVSGMAFGLTATTTMDVTANVVATCSVSATNIDFGNIDGSAIGTGFTGTITVDCNAQGVSYTVGLDAGLHYTPNIGRAVQNANGDPIYYSLSDPVGGVEWGDDNATYPANSVVGTSTGAAQQLTVNAGHGSANDGNSIFTPGTSYTDTVNVTVTY